MIKEKLVNIKRLIVKTENAIKESNGDLKGMDLVRCHSNISMMRQYLEEIKEENDNNEIDATSICEISNKIDQLSLLIDQDKMITAVKKNYSKSQKMNFGNSIDESFEYLIQRKAEKKIKNELFEVPEPLKEEKYSAPSAEDLRNDLLNTSNSNTIRQRSLYKNNEEEDDNDNVDNDEFKSLIANQKKIQEGYTDDLVKLAATLKANSLGFTELLKKDEKVREEADSLLQENVSNVQREGKKLKTLIKSTRSTKWFIYLIMLIVFLMFILTVLFIRIFPVQKR
ncbi:hypothetical protein BCR32DRAFT_272088 [Anaeromyces robustus]|uniref:Vesicle transport protein USE1 n=1 Tax=Anaeromyces robustus TaxID=1754192 RepID=A0A1Y1WNJ5_9FUNG|nr:hypothetical protein BCR32DRAFT_272088 [Anaeromyces robustus]|eukprot:ORX75127.1 hypothetical protein BCR32DRAFT_272088 [Anaeromyces robustus]